MQTSFQKQPKVALVHDHLIQDGGAERVLKVLQEIWPTAPIFTLLYHPTQVPFFSKKDIRTSFLQKLPFSLKKYQWYLPLMPSATEHYDLSAYDIVISSSSAFSKGVITRHDALHVCYCHTPTRYLWSDTNSYVSELHQPKIIKKFIPLLLSHLRLWDKQAADRVDQFIANSKTVRNRIEKYYRRPSYVIHPPVEVDTFSLNTNEKTFFLAGGRLVAYKRFDLVIKACNRLQLPLKIFGTGPLQKSLQQMAGPTVKFLGRVSDQEKKDLYEQCLAYIHPQEEDFGITAVEAMAAGRPVIAYKKGGALETIQEGVTGIFFQEQIWEDLADKLLRFRESDYDPQTIKTHAQKFSVKTFKELIEKFVNERWEEKQSAQGM